MTVSKKKKKFKKDCFKAALFSTTWVLGSNSGLQA